MITRKAKDVGMRRHVQESFSFDGPIDDEQLARLEAFLGSIPKAKPGDWHGDALRRVNAERCRAILGTVGLSDEGKGCADTLALREKGLTEASAQWIAAHWLAEYNIFIRAREKFIGGNTGGTIVARMICAAEEMGKLQERMWWRAGVDPITRRKREDLALAGRSNVEAIRTAGEETAKRHAPLRNMRFKRMADLIPTMGIENAARQCESEGLGGWQGIKRQWARFQKQRDT